MERYRAEIKVFGKKKIEYGFMDRKLAKMDRGK